MAQVAFGWLPEPLQLDVLKRACNVSSMVEEHQVYSEHF